MAKIAPATSYHAIVRQWLSNPDMLPIWAAKMEEINPELAKELAQYIKVNPGLAHESRGFEHWLRSLGPQSFTRPFAPIHKEFWAWNWSILQRLQDSLPIDPTDLNAFIPWSREYGKSTMVEWAAIAEGAMLRGGYVVYVSGRQSQAEEHVVAIRNRIEEEHVAKLYPWLGKPKMGVHGNKFGWAREFLMTSGGWAIRPVGLDVAIRGGKTLNMRPTLLIFDDIDELGDSPYVVENKERTLTRSILPMGTNNTRVLVAQNPIHENSMVNRMLTGASLALSVRKVFGPVPAMTNFAYEIRQTDDGPVPIITQGETTWPEVTREMWQATLQRVGPESFESEYQHNMSVALEERVLPEYDDRNLMLHVITWDMFEKMYGMRRIPPDWPCDLGVDLGYSAKHPSSWSFIARVPEGYPLAGSVYRYRGRNFTTTNIDDQSIAVRASMWPDEQLERQWLSHEKAGERLLLAQKHGWSFYPCHSGKEDGWTAWRHYLRPDHTQGHPFHNDDKNQDSGLWRLGRPAFFDIVVREQFRSPQDDFGLKAHRDSAFTQRRRPVRLTESGLTVDQPVKMGDDPNDSSRMIFSSTTFGPTERAMTKVQQMNSLIPDGYHRSELMQRTDISPAQATMSANVAEWFARRTMAEKKPKQRDYYGQVIAG